MSLLHLYLLVPGSLVAAAAGFLLYDRLVCRPRCWRHGHRPDFASIHAATWEAYFKVLPNVLETLRRKSFASPFAATLCAWRLDAFDRTLLEAIRGELDGILEPKDFCRCHRVVAYLARLAFPHSLHHTACITRLREAMDENRVEPSRQATAREVLTEHERRLGILTGLERRFGAPLPPEAAEYFYGLMLRWQALFEEHGFALHPELVAWRRERARLGF